jgi:hypothetical protein
MPALRGHHLICLHFFNGEGYSQEFVRNLEATLKKTEYSPVEICSGADEICMKCPYLKDNACHYDKNAEEEIRAIDSKALELLNLSAGGRAAWNDIRNAVPGIFIQWHGSCCKSCDWITACGKNAFFQRLLADKH